MSAFSVKDTFAGREVLLSGASGFVGKVWLVMMLDRIPEIGRIHLLVRPNGDGDPLRRIENIANTNPAFRPLHERHGAGLGEFLRSKIVVHAGDLTKVNLGLDPAAFRGKLDLVVNCAAVVDFEPDVRAAFRTNVQGSLHAAELARHCGAGLVQVSTCFANGCRDGTMPEQRLTELPNGACFDAGAEFAALSEAIEALERHHASAEFEAILRDEADAQLDGGDEGSDEEQAERRDRARSKRIASDWKALGVDRAAERGWPNTYTYTKGITEGLLFERFPDLPKVVFRPAVVESALSFPFPGWNEGFNTSGPLAYLIGTWFKAFPGRKDNPFDVVPVDLVCASITLAGAAILRGENHDVYQCSTSDRNRLTVGRATELSVLSQRTRLRREGKTVVQRMIQSRADTTLYEDGHPASIGNILSVMGKASATLRNLPERLPEEWREHAAVIAMILDRNRRGLRRVEFMVDTFAPFTRDLRQVFVSDNLSTHVASEPEFAWRPEELDWRSYWLDVHMPGMRKWSFPLFEGKKAPLLESPIRVDLHVTSEAAE